MLEHLKRLEQLRGSSRLDAETHAQIQLVKLWQQSRLRRTYADLSRQPRYAAAVQFFLDELYGTQDSSLRDRDLIRMYPTMQRLLPSFAFECVREALELDVLAEEFDQSMAKILPPSGITEQLYAAAFCAVGRQADRLHQVALIRKVGNGLEQVVKKPLIYSTLKMLRGPAKLAGLSNMQHFLEAGFGAFRQMNDADFFLSTITKRETTLIERIFTKEPMPFAIIDDWNQLNE